MHNPMVSIIVPVYKSELFISRCIESVLSQTINDFELILVDDGSPDNSGKICDQYAKHDARVFVYHKENGGAGAARKFGVKRARGEWIMFVDSDDTITCDCLALLHQHIEKADIICGTLNINNSRVFYHEVSGLLDNKEYIKALLLNKTSIGPVAKLIRRNLFDLEKWNDDKRIKNNEDLMMLLMLATRAESVYIDQTAICYNYLFGEGSLHNNISEASVWYLLFDVIEDTLKSCFNETPEFFYLYELHRVYDCIVLHGQDVDESSDRYNSILKKCQTLKLDRKDYNILKTITSPTKRRIAYLKKRTLSNFKEIVKNVINAK